jgi:hypothetical protein
VGTECAPFAPDQVKEEAYIDEYEAKKVFFNYTQQEAEVFYNERFAFYTHPLNRSKVTW